MANTKKKTRGKDKKPRKKRSTPSRAVKTNIRGRIDKGGKRWYTDEERGAALSALTANGGNVDLTSKQIGIPVVTLWAWSKGHRFPQALQLRNEKNGDLSNACEELAWLLASVVPEKIDKAPLNHITTAFGTLVDKARLLRGEPGSYGHNTNTNVTFDYSRLTNDERATLIALLAKGRGTGTGGSVSGGTRELGTGGSGSEVPRKVPAVLG